MDLLTDRAFQVLHELTSGYVLGRQDLRGLFEADPHATDPAIDDEIDEMMAGFGRGRLVHRTGPSGDAKWTATHLLMRRFRVLEALGPDGLETTEVWERVGGRRATVYADLRWWDDTGRVRSELTTSKTKLFFCAYDLDQTGDFIVITKANFAAHSSKPHRLGAFHPRVRDWFR